MKNLMALCGRFAVFAAIVSLLATATFSQVSLRKAMDFDGDGKADTTIFRPSNAVWFVSKSGGGFIIQQFGISNEDFQVPGDYDGDGKADIAVWRDSTGVWFVLGSQSNTVSAVQFGQSGDEPISRDYDGDGKTDFAVVRRSNGQMVWYVQGTTAGFSATQWGLSTDYTAPGDYDGDGKFDMTVQRPGATGTSQSIFFILKSTGGSQATQFGITNDLVVPGDYDGDGKTDLAVVREGATPTSNLIWYIRGSLANPNPADNNYTATSWGITGSDIIVQNDYDGDGKTDIAVWRESTGVYFTVKSTGGTSAVQWGQPNDYPTASYDTH